jgi:hypothetical protein
VLQQSLAADGFVFVHAADMRATLERYGPLADWTEFAASWNDLGVDEYLDAHGRFRKRRFAVFAAHCDGTIERQPHQPHFQHREYNALFGGVERWFAPILPEIGDGPSLRTILACCAGTFGALAPTVKHWHVEVHQFRIEARPDLPGQPTPEGVHRDGVDFVLVLLVNRDNIASGVTTVYDRDGAPLGSFTLTDPCDAALVDDDRVAHGVTPVVPIDSARSACRDVLVVTFRNS